MLGRVREDVIPQVADMGLQAEGAEWAIAAGIVGSDLVFSVRNVGYVRAAGDVVRAVVEGLGVGGGHRSMAKGIIPLRAFRKVYGGRLAVAHPRPPCARRSCTRSTGSPSSARWRGDGRAGRMLDDLLAPRISRSSSAARRPGRAPRS